MKKRPKTRFSLIWALAFLLVLLGSEKIALAEKVEGEEIQTKVELLIQQLKDNDPTVRSKAVQALGKIGLQAKDAVPSLIQVLKKDDDPGKKGDVGSEATYFSWRIGLPGKRDHLSTCSSVSLSTRGREMLIRR